MSLVAYAFALENSARPNEALDAGVEAVELLHQISADHVNPRSSTLARALIQLGRQHLALGGPREALLLANEAVQLLKVVAESQSDAYERLASALDLSSRAATALGFTEMACKTMEEAITATLCHALQAPTSWSTFHLPDRYTAHAELSETLGHLEKALSSLVEAERQLRARLDSGTFTPASSRGRVRQKLALTLWEISSVCSQTARHIEALAAAKECTWRYRKLLDDCTSIGTLYDVNEAQDRLLACYEELGQLEEADRVRQEVEALQVQMALRLATLVVQEGRRRRPSDAKPDAKVVGDFEDGRPGGQLLQAERHAQIAQ
jgi:tetratricopeptide (TPR) repeat protein